MAPPHSGLVQSQAVTKHDANPTKQRTNIECKLTRPGLPLKSDVAISTESTTYCNGTVVELSLERPRPRDILATGCDEPLRKRNGLYRSSTQSPHMAPSVERSDSLLANTFNFIRNQAVVFRCGCI